jgi:outer membrane protein insertion porin family
LRQYRSNLIHAAAVVLAVSVAHPGVNDALGQTAPDRVADIVVRGNQRIEPETIRSYLSVNVGDPFTPAKLDESLKTLFATGLFADVNFARDGNTLIVNIVENPIINRLAYEGNKQLDDEKLGKEVHLKPRIVFTKAKVRADVQRIIELYRRSGRFAATVEPKVIQLPQNRVDLVFEISEGPKTKVSRINFIGNHRYSDGDLRDVVATREARWWRFLTSNDTYDPDRLAYDRELMRQYYLAHGYADFRVASSVAELTQDKKHFLITMTVEEGERYKFGKIDVESEIRDVKPEILRPLIKTKQGNIYNAKLIDDTIEAMTEAAGLKGYAFVDIRPNVNRDRKTRIISITYKVLEAPRVYVERIDIHGNVRTLDKVVRREFRLVEGDAFNTAKMRRSKQRIKALGFFKEADVQQLPGSGPDKTILDVNVQEQSTGELSLNVGFSSVENFIIGAGVSERNLLGTGQSASANVSFSSKRQEVDLSFTNPYFMGKNLAAGVDLFARQSNYSTESSFDQTSYGTGVRTAFPLAEFTSMGLRYTIRRDKLSGSFQIVSPYVLEALQRGGYITSSVGYSFIYDTLDDRLKPTRGMQAVISQDISGLGGDVHNLRNRASVSQYFPLADKWVLKFSGEGGYIFGLGEDIFLSDRFFNSLRGFQIRGIGPRDKVSTDSLGGNIYYTGTAELLVPLGSAASEMGLKSSVFADVGSLFKLNGKTIIDPTTGLPDIIVGNTAKPRISVGVGFSWNSPFGPFRIDLAKAIRKNPYDKTEFFQFNISSGF